MNKLNEIADSLNYYKYFKIKYKDKDIFRQPVANKIYDDIKTFVTIKTKLRKQKITKVTKIVFNNLVLDCYYWGIAINIKSREN